MVRLILGIVVLVIIGLIALAIFPTMLSFINPFTPRGEIIGDFVKGEHEGFGDLCGQYPFTRIKLRNATYNKEHFYSNTFYFGNQYKNVDSMKIGTQYKLCYHKESRCSDTTSGDTIYYWVIDKIMEVKSK